MYKLLLPIMLMISQVNHAASGDGSGNSPEARFLQYCMETNQQADQNKARLMCEAILSQRSTGDGTGKPSTDDGTGRP